MLVPYLTRWPWGPEIFVKTYLKQSLRLEIAECCVKTAAPGNNSTVIFR